MKTSIALCTYNGEQYIREQIHSLASQTVCPDEIIISDDCSTDATTEIVRTELADAGIPWSMQINAENLGVAGNFEQAIQRCTGDIIFLCDQDDVWQPHKIERHLSVYQDDVECQMVFSNASLVDADLSDHGGSLWASLHFDPDSMLGSDQLQVFQLFLRNNYATGATMSFRKKLSDCFLPVSRNWIHDYWIVLFALTQGHFVALPDQLILYRQHAANVLGARHLSINERFAAFIGNGSQIRTIRTDRFIKSQDLYNRMAACPVIAPEYLDHVRNYRDFWQKLLDLDKLNRKNATRVVVASLRRGDYQQYYSGLRSAALDLYTLWLQRRQEPTHQ